MITLLTLQQFADQTVTFIYGNPPPILEKNKGTYIGECTSYVRQYLEAVLGMETTSYGDATSWFTNPKLHEYFDAVLDGTRYDGDILCWQDDDGNWTGPAGHVAISLGGKILNQNFSASKKVSINNFFGNGYQGALRLKGSNDMKITDAIFRNIWTNTGFDVGPEARQPSKKEVEEALGREYGEFMAYWLNTEAVKARIAQGAFYKQDLGIANKKIEELSNGYQQLPAGKYIIGVEK